MRKLIFGTAICVTQTIWATDYVYPGNATAPLYLQGNDTLTINSGTFSGSPYAVTNSATTLGQSVTIESGATISGGSYCIYGSSNGPFTITNRGTMTATTSIYMAGSSITLNQNSTTSISGSVTVGPNSTVNYNSSGGSGFLQVGANSVINFNSTGVPTTLINGVSNVTMNINNTVTLPTIDKVQTININSGTATLGSITNLNSALNVASGATLALGANTISGTGNVVQSGTLTATNTASITSLTGSFSTSGTTTMANPTMNCDFTVSGGTTTFTGSSFTQVNKNFYITSGTVTYSAGYVVVNSGASIIQSGGVFQPTSSASFQLNTASYVISGGTLSRNNGGSNTINSSSFIMSGGTVNWAAGCTVNESTIQISGGTFNQTSGSSFTMNGSTFTLTGGTFNATAGAGLFLNPLSNVNISGGTFANAGTLSATNNVTFNISGTPSINLTGLSFSSNLNNYMNYSFGANSLPNVNVASGTVNVSNAVINITNSTEEYIAAGDYPFITANAGATLTLGTVNLPASTQYAQYSLINSNGVAKIQVTRTPISSLISSQYEQEVVQFLESVASSSINNTLLLSGLKEVQTLLATGQSEEAVAQLSPQNISTISQIENTNATFQQIGTRLASLRQSPRYYLAGDELYGKNIWLAPYGDHAHQSNGSSLQGYTSNTAGLIFGGDYALPSSNTVGIAGGYSYSRTTPTNAPGSLLTTYTYQAALYGTYELKQKYNLDWILSYNRANNNSLRAIEILNLNAFAKYRTYQYTAKGILSQDIKLSSDFTISPEVSAQYLYWHQQQYSETGAGALDYDIASQHTSLFRVGIGGWLTFTQQSISACMIPQLYGAILYDLKEASQNISANLVNTTPILNNSGQPPRLGGLVGARLTCKLYDNLNLILNYNFQFRNRYTEQFGDLRLKYSF